MNIQARSQEVLAFIRSFGLERGYPPTLREIAAGVGYSPRSKSTVHDLIKYLARAGALTYRPGTKRSITLTPQAPVISVELPVHLFAAVQAFAAKAQVTPEAVVIEAVRSGFEAFRSRQVLNIDHMKHAGAPA